MKRRKSRIGVKPASMAAGAALVGALLTGSAMAQEEGAESFAEWREGVRSEALELGISAATFDTAFVDVEPIPRVIELDRSQPEVTLTFDQYVERVVPDSRVEKGRKLLAEHRELLEPIGRTYGVPPRFIVALWGIETNFGQYLGGFPVIASLATLAYDGRRSAYFRQELLHALRILQDGHVTTDAMMGSWAGAMGQSQFMPSSFVNYAVDHDGDGKRDIWGSQGDVFASAANYLAQAGWRAGETWGRHVALPSGFDHALTGLEVKKTLAEWQALGLRRADGSDLPRADISGSVVLPGGEGGPAFLVYNNYRTIMRWNRSFYFATSVGLLADGIGRR